MKKNLLLLFSVYLVSILLLPVFGQTDTNVADTAAAAAAAATGETSSGGGGTDWFSIIVAGAYLLGVFLLLPVVIYTNLNEKIHQYNPDRQDQLDIQNLSQEVKEQKAMAILERIDEKLDHFTDEEGNELVTITKGRQARYLKCGLDYINRHLQPVSDEVNQYVEEFTELYSDRVKRTFTGSKWIIGCGAGILVLMGLIDASMLIEPFAIIHLLGLVFYILSSRTTQFTKEKREERFGSRKPGVAGLVFGSLFAGFAVKEYVSVNGGPWKRDYEGEFSSSIILIFIIAVVAILVSFLVAFFGVINFVLNYSTSFLNPFRSEQRWYEKEFEIVELNPHAA